MIVAAGLSPAWQTVMRFPALVPGEVNRAISVCRCASGKVLNVAIALEALGCATRAVTVLGGPAGAATVAEFSTRAVDLVAVPTAAETRSCTTLLDDATGRTTELVENAGPLTVAELDRFLAAYTDGVAEAVALVISGSLPAGVPDTIHRDLLRRCRAPAVLDARGAELLAALPERPLLVKPNREELARTVGRVLDGDAVLETAMEEIARRGARWVLVTDGPRPARLLGPTGEHLRVVPPRLDRVENPIGSGDCLAAGFAAAIVAGHAPVAAVRRGMACAADNCRSIHAGRLDRAEVARLEALVVVETC